tara:strand:+ start:129 stop:296 length:168 start_codon:yes stop_codon:yes gene_type:complete
MDQNYSIDEILSAVNDIQTRTKDTKKISKIKSSEKDYSEVPKHTLKLIQEAEEIK